jgi:hypothetical protein
MMGNLMDRMGMIRIPLIILLITVLMVSIAAAAPANDTDTGLKLPSPVRGWSTAPEEAKTWSQTLLDWGAMVAAIVAIAVLIIQYIRGRVADTAGSIQDRNDSTSKMIQVVVGAIILIVAVAFVWQIFWK